VNVTVLPASAITIRSFTLPTDISGGGSGFGPFIQLTGPAPAGGAVITLGGGRTNVIDFTPATINIPAGSTTASMTYTTYPFLGFRRATDFTATYAGITQSLRISIEPVTLSDATPHSRPIQCASASIAPCLTAAALEPAVTAAGDPSRYYLQTPELSLLAETELTTASAKNITSSYIWFSGQPVAQIDTTTNTTRWYATDHLGTPLIQTDASGTVIWRAEYTPYGDLFATRTGAALHQPLRLPGQFVEDGGELANNVFRWYRAGWGRYGQADRYIPVRAREPNVFTYTADNPARFIDPKGLYRIGPSCDCPAQLTNIPKTISQSCRYLRNPKCIDLLHKYTMTSFYSNQRTEPLDQCMRRRCSADENGSGPHIECSNATGSCGWTPPNGDIVLYRGNQTCPRVGTPNGPTGPRDYSQTLFHESLHTCGWPAEGFGMIEELYNITKVCTGWEG
jgi:RHS repeat-associated protein